MAVNNFFFDSENVSVLKNSSCNQDIIYRRTNLLAEERPIKSLTEMQKSVIIPITIPQLILHPGSRFGILVGFKHFAALNGLPLFVDEMKQIEAVGSIA